MSGEGGGVATAAFAAGDIHPEKLAATLAKPVFRTVHQLTLVAIWLIFSFVPHIFNFLAYVAGKAKGFVGESRPVPCAKGTRDRGPACRR